MKYTLVLAKGVQKQLLLWNKLGDSKSIQKILALFAELELHPMTSTGQVEQLKGNLAGLWSRRINKQHRMIYSIHEEIITVEVISVRGHYGDK
ncbi:MAG: addiction module toxin YoeB [Bacteroidales bacterium 45-6]|mgnify:CR=1 FL=1|nr:MAG: addiction module toxin YoeB [Bacteroidales bacterium 45-6]